MPERKRKNTAVDPNALVQEVLREPYLQTTEDLRFYAEKVRAFNASKKAVRTYLVALRKFRAQVTSVAHNRGVDLSRGDKKDLVILNKLFRQHAYAYVAGTVERELGIPARVPRTGVDSLDLLEAEIKQLEEQLNTIGDDAQLANVDLQNVLQKQQQTLQMMSNISKMLYDTAQSIIRKMGG